jgi:hypothetical protein
MADAGGGFGGECANTVQNSSSEGGGVEREEFEMERLGATGF